MGRIEAESPPFYRSEDQLHFDPSQAARSAHSTLKQQVPIITSPASRPMRCCGHRSPKVGEISWRQDSNHGDSRPSSRLEILAPKLLNDACAKGASISSRFWFILVGTQWRVEIYFYFLSETGIHGHSCCLLRARLRQCYPVSENRVA